MGKTCSALSKVTSKQCFKQFIAVDNEIMENPESACRLPAIIYEF